MGVIVVSPIRVPCRQEGSLSHNFPQDTHQLRAILSAWQIEENTAGNAFLNIVNRPEFRAAAGPKTQLAPANSTLARCPNLARALRPSCDGIGTGLPAAGACVQVRCVFAAAAGARH